MLHLKLHTTVADSVWIISLGASFLTLYTSKEGMKVWTIHSVLILEAADIQVWNIVIVSKVKIQFWDSAISVTSKGQSNLWPNAWENVIDTQGVFACFIIFNPMDVCGPIEKFLLLCPNIWSRCLRCSETVIREKHHVLLTHWLQTPSIDEACLALTLTPFQTLLINIFNRWII